MHLRTSYCLLGIAGVCVILGGCGGDSGTSDASVVTQATRSAMHVAAPVAGSTPFIAFAAITGTNLQAVSSVGFEINAKAGATAVPVHVTFSRAYLQKRLYLARDNSVLSIPIFGLYAGRQNQIVIDATFEDGSTTSVPVSVTTATYVDPNAVFDRPTIITSRVANKSIGYDYFFFKSSLGTPIVIDVDGETRWVGAAAVNSTSSILVNNGFVVPASGIDLQRLELDGSSSPWASIQSSNFTGLTHNIAPGKSGVLVEPDATIAGQSIIESIAADVDSNGVVQGEWNFGDILSRQMSRGGDDPSLFVRPGTDWFHINSAVYDARDDSIIASSRENFVVKVDYSSGEIKWIFGDPTKYWYTFSSLRAKAVSLAGVGLYPDGQHSVNLSPPTGDLLLFDNGDPSGNQPAGTPGGEVRTFSTVASYNLNESALSAIQTWSFDHDQNIYSSICSSAEQLPDGSLLLLYSSLDNDTHARVVGLDAQRTVVFEYQYDKGCPAAFNAQVIRLESLMFN